MHNCDKNLIVDWKLLDYIKTLRKHYKVILRSNMDITSIRQIKKEVPLKTFFDAIYFSRDYKMGKTDKEMIQYISTKHKCITSETVFIDDTPRNFTQLHKDGYHTIVYS